MEYFKEPHSDADADFFLFIPRQGSRTLQVYGGRKIAIMVMILLGDFSCPAFASPRSGTASWYSLASTTREGTGGTRHLMSNGRPLNDHAFTAASWDYRFGTHLVVSSVGPDERPRIVRVVVTDRGPARRLYRHGRILDLSQAAFATLAPLSQGVIPITVEPVE